MQAHKRAETRVASCEDERVNVKPVRYGWRLVNCLISAVDVVLELSFFATC